LQQVFFKRRKTIVGIRISGVGHVSTIRDGNYSLRKSIMHWFADYK
jgi:hypothetical protein